MFGFGRHSVNARLVWWAARLDMMAIEVRKHPEASYVAYSAKTTLDQYEEFIGWLREYMLARGSFEEFQGLRDQLGRIGRAAQVLETELNHLDPDQTREVVMDDWEHTQLIGRVS